MQTKSSTVRPQTSGGPSMRPTGNFYGGGGLASNNFVNNFSAGSNADISHEAVMKHEAKGNTSTEDIYGTSTAAASKP